MAHMTSNLEKSIRNLRDSPSKNDVYWVITPQKTVQFFPENRPKGPKRKRLIFQPSILKGENVSFREGM